MKAIYLRAAVAVVLAASVHACSSDSVTNPDEGGRASLDQVLNEAAQPELMEFGTRAVMVSAPMLWPSTAAFSSSGCSYEAGSQSFVCASRSSGGLTFERSYALYDAAGNAQSEFSRSTTAAVRTKMRIAGTLNSSVGTLTLDNVDDRTVSGLLTSRHVLNGTSAWKMDGTFDTGTPSAPTRTPMTNASTTTIENLVLPSAANKWPGPGTMTVDGTSSFGTTPPMTTRMRMTFNGTKCVVISIEMDGFTESMTMDLSNPSAMGCTP